MIKNIFLKEIAIGEIVATDFRAAELFRNAGIDFCCGGKKSLDEACIEKNIDSEQFINQLQELQHTPVNQSQNFNDWNLGFLADYIVNTHHQYVLKSLPELVFYTEKIATVHGDHHPELLEVSDLFGKINTELLQHLKKEEEILFPAIREVLKNPSSGLKTTIATEIQRMGGEHEFAGGAMDHINMITQDYSLPEDACNTYRVAFKLLKQFEDDLHVHVHLENNILYPKALAL